MAVKKKASNAEILKQVLYEMLTLAHSVEFLTKNRWIKGQSLIDSSEVIKTASVIKMRLLYDFLYSQKPVKKTEAVEKGEICKDDYTAQNDFNITVPKPNLVGCDAKGMFTRQSVNKYIVHLTEERITKPKEIPLPKFNGGSDSIIKNSALILASAEKFIDSLAKGNFLNLNQEGEYYLEDFKKTVIRLKENPIFNQTYK
ncbi:MAG: hypothetical protein WCS96_00365 [Victivallales bacterium]|jgi:hypothetical protein